MRYRSVEAWRERMMAEAQAEANAQAEWEAEYERKRKRFDAMTVPRYYTFNCGYGGKH